jgi:hypothetical protein
MATMRTINASDITRGMSIRYPVHFLPFTSRKLDHDGFHYDCVDGIVACDDEGTITVFGFDKVVTLPQSQYVHVIEIA